MRINKFISESGICSRREADAWIEAGRVTISGAVATLGSQVSTEDVVCVDGQRLGAKKLAIYVALNKPVGITCTTESNVPGNIVDFIKHRERIFPIGRLDKDSEGLILLTNNGDIVNEILRAERAHEKEYVVTVDKPVTDAFLHGIASGVQILGTVTRPCRTKRVASTVFSVVLTQGLNRQIRRMCSAFGYRVRRLQRIRIMHINLDKLPSGQWRDLTEQEVTTLLSQCAGLQSKSTVR
ncbi:MAG: 23S rRNA pseudouridine(2604) synthase RluF [Candidatus Obscuribacterales bacterium]|nr:23S rRNA pseudouridine(2604) synthase RluF [Steroidobacteraceae bacterium]